MRKYFSRPRAAWDDDVPLLPSLEVDDHVPVDTGLLDSRGYSIFREPNSIGFHNPKERC